MLLAYSFYSIWCCGLILCILIWLLQCYYCVLVVFIVDDWWVGYCLIFVWCFLGLVVVAVGDLVLWFVVDFGLSGFAACMVFALFASLCLVFDSVVIVMLCCVMVDLFWCWLFGIVCNWLLAYCVIVCVCWCIGLVVWLC